ncbi:MAG: sensor histidine kinase [Desulfobaccales bacterium]
MNDEKALTQRIAELEKELTEITKQNNNYMQNVAHQLTAPLGAIKWSIEALLDETVPIKRKMTLLRSIYSQATTLVHLIKNFALMSNLEADLELGQFREKPSPEDIMRLSINLSNDFQPQAHDKNIKIIVNDESFKRCLKKNRLIIEKNMISQAISNIIENAVKYSDQNSTINISASKDDQSFYLHIESFGIAIDINEKLSLFNRGFRGNAAKQKVPAGTGIGLYLASRIMYLHGGDILLETDNKLTRLSLKFPINRIEK